MGAKTGDTVRVHYRGTLDDGEEFDSSSGREPLQFKIGEGAVIPGFEEAVLGLEPGESRTVTIPPDQAYGEHHSEAVQAVELEAFGERKPELGDMVNVMSAAGDQLCAVIADVGDEEAMLDFNHPLAGKTLTFEVELVDIG